MKRSLVSVIFFTIAVSITSCDNSTESDKFETRTIKASITGYSKVYTIAGLLSSSNTLTDDIKNDFLGGYPEFIDLVSENKAIFRYPLNSWLSGLSVNVTYYMTDTTQVFLLNSSPNPEKYILYKKGNELQSYSYIYEYHRVTENSSYYESRGGELSNPNDITLPKSLVGNDTLRYSVAIISYK